MDELRELTDRIGDAVSQSATAVEGIHRRIAEIPLDVFERVGVFERTAGNVRSFQDASIGAVYDTIRDVNRGVTRLVGDLLAGGPRKS